MMDKELDTKLAALSHSIWSSWMIWMFTVGNFNDDGTWTMPKNLVKRWSRQMNTDFYDLPVYERNLDYEQAYKILNELNERR